MYRIAILGCENSHANVFLNYIIKDGLYPDITVEGVYSDDYAAAQKLHDEYGVYAAKSYDEFAGKTDGIIITARHGDNHYKYAKPYIEYGIPLFIDKPVTISENEAKSFMEALEKHNVRVCGGSVCVFAKEIQKLKKIVQQKEYGIIYGGFLRAPVDLNNAYGNFYFYSQHLVQVMTEIFGNFPNSVKAYINHQTITCVVRYDDFDVSLEFNDKNYLYYANVSCEQKVLGFEYGLDGCFEHEFGSFYQLLTGKEQTKTYEEFFAPVFIMNAIDRSLQSNHEEPVRRMQDV